MADSFESVIEACGYSMAWARDTGKGGYQFTDLLHVANYREVREFLNKQGREFVGVMGVQGGAAMAAFAVELDAATLDQMAEAFALRLVDLAAEHKPSDTLDA